MSIWSELKSRIVGGIMKTFVPRYVPINFSFREACPKAEHRSSADESAWLKTYVDLFQAQTKAQQCLLLWKNQFGHLNVALKWEEHFYEVRYEQFEIPENGLISLNEIEADFPDGLRLHHDVYVPSQDDIRHLKFQAHIARKVITPELMQEVDRHLDQQLENVEACTNCSICLDEYTKEKPPFLVFSSQQVYHESCIRACWEAENQSGRPLKDPLKNEAIIIPEVRRVNDIDDFFNLLFRAPRVHDLTALVPKLGAVDRAYLRMLTEVKETKSSIVKLTKVIKVLSENQSAQAAPVAHVGVARDRHAQPEQAEPAVESPQPVVGKRESARA